MLNVKFVIKNMLFGNISKAKVGFDHSHMKKSDSPNIDIESRKSKNEIELVSEIESRNSKIKITSEIESRTSKNRNRTTFVASEIEYRKSN